MYEIGLFQNERREWEEEREQIQVVSDRQALEIRRLSAELEIRPEPEVVRKLTAELATEKRRSLSLNQPADSERQPEVPGSRTCLLATISCLQANLQREKERVQSLEDDVLGLREELNTEKDKAVETKLAEQSRRTAWRGELSKFEELHTAALADAERLRLELSRKETAARTELRAAAQLRCESGGAAEQSPQKLREILSMFLVHVQEPLAVVRGVCTDLCAARAQAGRDPPPGPSPVRASSGDDAVVAELVRLVELLRFFATAVDERRSLRTPAQQPKAADDDGCRRARPLPASDERYAVSPTSIRPAAKVPSGAVQWVAAIDDTVERMGVATAAAVANPKWVSDLDETTDRVAEWLLSKLPP